MTRRLLVACAALAAGLAAPAFAQRAEPLPVLSDGESFANDQPRRLADGGYDWRNTERPQNLAGAGGCRVTEGWA